MLLHFPTEQEMRDIMSYAWDRAALRESQGLQATAWHELAEEFQQLLGDAPCSLPLSDFEAELQPLLLEAYASL